MNNPIPQCAVDSPEWVFQTVEMINGLQRRLDNLAVEHTALCEAVHKAMGRTAACDKKQTNDQLIADVAYLKRLAYTNYMEAPK